MSYVCREDGQIDFDALEQFENPDVHQNSLQSMNLFNRIKQVLDQSSTRTHRKIQFRIPFSLRRSPKAANSILRCIFGFEIALDMFSDLPSVPQLLKAFGFLRS